MMNDVFRKVYLTMKSRVFTTVILFFLLGTAVFQLTSLKRLRVEVHELNREVGPLLPDSMGGDPILMPLTLPQTLIGLILLADTSDRDLRLTRKEGKAILKLLPAIDKSKVNTDFEDEAEDEKYYLEKINSLLDKKQIQFMYRQLPLDITRIPTRIAKSTNLSRMPVPLILKACIEELLKHD
jgi:hypothetical protein